jgi:hypothetical protein
MYWMVLSTLFWVATYGQYPSKEACVAAMADVPIYVSASCVPTPQKSHDHKASQ